MDEKPIGGNSDASIVEKLEAKLSAPETAEAAPQAEGTQEESRQEETEVKAPGGDETEESEGPQYQLSDVAKMLGVEETALDVDDDGTVKFKTKIDGTEGAAKLKDFLASYQLKGHIDNRVRQISETEKALAAKHQQFEEFATGQAQQLWTLAQVAQQTVLDEFANVNWDDLARTDPIEHVAKKQAYDSKTARINQLMAAAQDYGNRATQAQQYRAHQQLQAEAQRLPSLIPEWANPQVAETERSATAQWLQSKGVNQAAINGLGDAALVAILRNAMKSEGVQAKAPEVEKKVRAAPKLIRPGSPVDANQRNAEGLRELKTQIQKSGGKGDSVAEYLIRTGRV